MKLSAALIVKNEESCLETCLKTLAGVDEIVICDTGSTDKTIEIAKKYTDKIFTDYTWEDSFAKARNHALSKCTGDWVLSIDADEILLDGGLSLIRKAIEEHPNEFAFSITMRAAGSGNECLFPKVFKRCKEVFWLGAAHNYISKRATIHTGAVIVYGYSKAHAADMGRTLRILQKEVDEDRTKARETFYLAREYFYRKQWITAIHYYERYLKIAQWLPEKADAYLMLARCLWAMKEGEAARNAVMNALKINPNFKEAAVFMSEIVWPKHKRNWLEFAKAADNTDVLFVRKRPEGGCGGGGVVAVNRATVSKPDYPMDLLDAPRRFIENVLLEYRKVDVLEWGAGNSTLYFPALLRKAGIEFTWQSMEHDRGWFEKLVPRFTRNIRLTLAGKDTDDYLKPKGTYDVIYVDGRNRVKCLEYAKTILNPGGVVILHDAERERYASGFAGYNYSSIETGKSKLWYGWIKSIPKSIHQIWIGPEPKPVKLMDTWVTMNPEFTYALWTEKEIDALCLVNRKVYDAYYAKKCFSGAVNIARAEILQRFGGVYVDADSKCITTLEKAPFMNSNFFTVYAVEGVKRIANSPIGCVPGHHIISEYVRRQGELKELFPSFQKSGPVLWTELIKEPGKVLPAYTFLPVFHRGHVNKVHGPVYAEHYWNTTKGKTK